MSGAKSQVDTDAIARLLRFIAKGPVKIMDTASPDKVTLSSDAYGAISVCRCTVKSVVARNLANLRGTRLTVGDAGRAWLLRLECGGDAFAGQHRLAGLTTISDENGDPPGKRQRRGVTLGKPAQTQG